jgi:DHA1 family bicyclomycin/chloramphenicol resistance-like MFS transporter
MAHPNLALWLGILSAVAPLSIDMYLPAFPLMERELGVPAGGAQVTLATFFLGLGVGQLIYGPLADRFGRRPPMIVGSAIYTLAALSCVFAADMGQLAALRLLQALGGCASMVVSRAMVRDVAQGAAAARLMSRLMLVLGAAPILAPSLGAIVLPFVGWRGIFLLLALYGVASIVIAWRILPESLPWAQRQPLAPGTIARNYVAAAADRSFLGNALAGGFAIAAMFAWIAGSPGVLIDGFGLSSTQYAILFGAGAFALILASQANPALLRRHRPARILSRAMLAFVLAGALLALAGVFDLGLVALLVPLWSMTACLGLILPNSTVCALAEQGARAGTASALLGTLQFGLGGVSVAVMQAVHDGTAVPMTLTMAGVALLAFGADRLVTRDGR